MTTIVKNKADVVVPRSIRRQAGIKAGDRLEFKASSRTITITATEPAEIARGEFVTLDDLLHALDNRRRKGGAKTTQKNSR
jgi:bifunctional DNA-binding transcriptional regulator/antitoxin component of YhaV-PrlF toxin-antitoxin module